MFLLAQATYTNLHYLYISLLNSWAILSFVSYRVKLLSNVIALDDIDLTFYLC